MVKFYRLFVKILPIKIDFFRSTLFMVSKWFITKILGLHNYMSLCELYTVNTCSMIRHTMSLISYLLVSMSGVGAPQVIFSIHSSSFTIATSILMKNNSPSPLWNLPLPDTQPRMSTLNLYLYLCVCLERNLTFITRFHLSSFNTSNFS